MAEEAHQYAKEVYKYARKVASEDRPIENNTTGYGELLSKTIQELKAQLEDEQKKLAEKEASVDQSSQISLELSDDSATLLRQRKVIGAAYRRLTQSKPWLPSPSGSALPSLLALRAASEASTDTRALIPKAQGDLKTARRQLAAEESRLSAFTVLGQTLESRIGELVAERDRQAQLSAADVARERLAELQAKEEAYHAEANELAADLKWFLKEHLAPMLAVEKHGGPPVGDLLHVSDELIGAGFTAQHKSKLRLEEEGGMDGLQTQAAARRTGAEYRKSVYDEVRRLMQNLLNAAAGDGQDPEGWVDVDAQSVVVQFLITVKVAMFHPDDARKIRLLDFAG